MRSKWAGGALVATLIGGCSTHPIPADVIRFTIYDIVHKVRCEARESVLEHYLAGGLDKKQVTYNEFNKRIAALQASYKARFGTRAAELEAERKSLAISERFLRAEIARLRNLLQDTLDAAAKPEQKRNKQDENLLSDDELAKRRLKKLKELEAAQPELERRIYRHNSAVVRFEKATFTHQGRIARVLEERRRGHADLQAFLGNTFAYSLRFEIEETNDTRISSADFTWPITSGTLTLGILAGDKRLRKGKREVRVVVGFEELLGRADCTEAKGLDPNGTRHVLRYPIRGRIGLDEVIDQYLVLQKKAKLKATFDSGPTYRSVITFTTTIDGSLKPGVTITRVSGRKFTGGSTLMGKREDLHEVTVVIEPPPSAKEVAREQTVNVRIIENETLLDSP